MPEGDQSSFTVVGRATVGEAVWNLQYFGGIVRSMPGAWCSVCVEMMVFCLGECRDGTVQAFSLGGRRARRLPVTVILL